MKSHLFSFSVGLSTLAAPAFSVANPLLLTGIFDSPNGARGVEFYVTEDIVDLSQYAVTRGTNGRLANGLPGADDAEPRLVLPAVPVSKGTFIYAAERADRFESFFGFAPDFQASLSFNGDDAAAILVRDNNSSTGWSILDLFGTQTVAGEEPAIDTSWNYEDSFFYRKDGTSASTTFDIDDWFFPTTGNPQSDHWDTSGPTNGSNGTEAFPLGSYVVPEPTSLAFLFVGAATLLNTRRRGH